jgi:D-sedoheptulose 7-phosphate isomerase
MAETMKSAVIRELEESILVKQNTAKDLPDVIVKAARLIKNAYRAGKKVLLVGNGGSAADAQHIATELVGRFLMERQALPAIALTTDTSVLTAIANDYGYETVFSRQIEALGEKDDVLFAITTSGASPNILKAIATARARKMRVIILTGAKGGSLRAKGDAVIIVPSEKSPRIQEAHITIGHIICYLVEKEVGNETGGISR